jgi:hypothetical protein
VTSVGPGCKTPCSVAVAAPDAGFSVTFTLPKFQPVTVPVQAIHNPGDFATPASTTIDHHRSQSGGRGTEARRPAAQGASAAAEKAEAAASRSARSRTGRRLALPRSERTGTAEPLIVACRIVTGWQRA